MLYASHESPVVQAGGKMKNPADEVTLAQSAFVLYDSQDLSSADGMLDLDAGSGYLRVGGFLLGCELLPSGLLHWLYDVGVLRSVPLISGVLLKVAGIGKRIHGVRNLLVMHLPLHRWACEENESCQCGDYSVLDGVFLLLAAVVLRLSVGVGRTGYLPLGAVMDEVMDYGVATALVKEPAEGPDVGGRKHGGRSERILQNIGQGVDPLPALLLGHPEARSMIFLRGIVLEVHKKEEQPIGHGGKRAVGLNHMGTLPGEFFTFDIMPSEIVVMRVCEKFQNLVKKRYTDACERQKRSRGLSDFRVVHLFYNVLITRVRA